MQERKEALCANDLERGQTAAAVQNRGTSRLTATGGVSHTRGCKLVALGLLDSPCTETTANTHSRRVYDF